MKWEKYTCGSCDEEFISENSDEEAASQYKKDFPLATDNMYGTVCEVCYKKIMKRICNLSVEEKKLYGIIG